MQLQLKRFAYSDTETEGKLYLNDDEFVYTLERPWIDGVPGGVPFKSCVPDGEYELVPHERENGDDVFALWNPARGVYYTEQERADNPGRYLILIHSANLVSQVVGCIAPGLSRTIVKNKRWVGSSRDAMKKIMAHKYDSILITPALGAKQ